MFVKPADVQNGLFDRAVEHYTEAIQRLDAEGLEDEVPTVAVLLSRMIH